VLVLTRKINEVVVIGTAIQVQVLEIRHGRVKLGFSGSRDVLIERQELRRRIAASKAVPHA